MLSYTGNLYPGIHAHFQATSEALALQISQNTNECLRSPEKISFTFQPKVPETSVPWLTGNGNIFVWSLEIFSIEKRHAISSGGEDTHLNGLSIAAVGAKGT